MRGTGQVRAATGVSRFGLALVSLLVLLGVTVAPARGVGIGHAGAHGVVAESVSSAPTLHDDLHDRPRLSVTAGHVPATTLHETWWALCSPATDARVPRGRPPVGEVSGSGLAATVPTSRSSRAPPA
ncbi:hypothetical protein LZG04_30370 [Saccharothrix sp. S26]|uniref:hypothetical protein n=1 Tax=Saccharothrix sp. S26 TaxID=2907215 RepID=UPI001F3B4119|nr:hypothetical protein [Saccharothrix sp. S26]MCE6999077.1 hypothetical protein [Saccharothrix sp. S26]